MRSRILLAPPYQSVDAVARSLADFSFTFDSPPESITYAVPHELLTDVERAIADLRIPNEYDPLLSTYWTKLRPTRPNPV